MVTLKIDTAENGFVVQENSHPHEIGKQWAFESAETLADFIHDWGVSNTKAKVKPETKSKP